MVKGYSEKKESCEERPLAPGAPAASSFLTLLFTIGLIRIFVTGITVEKRGQTKGGAAAITSIGFLAGAESSVRASGRLNWKNAAFLTSKCLLGNTVRRRTRAGVILLYV